MWGFSQDHQVSKTFCLPSKDFLRSDSKGRSQDGNTEGYFPVGRLPHWLTVSRYRGRVNPHGGAGEGRYKVIWVTQMKIYRMCKIVNQGFGNVSVLNDTQTLNLRGEMEDRLTVGESCQCLDCVNLVPVGRISVSPPLIWRKFGKAEFGVIGKAAEMSSQWFSHLKRCKIWSGDEPNWASATEQEIFVEK